MSNPMTLEVAGAERLFNRDQLATAILLRLDNPDNARAVVDALEADHGAEHYEAMRLVMAAQKCIDLGIEP